MSDQSFVSPSGSTITEAEDFLHAHPEVEAIDIMVHDSNGIGRGKIIRRHELLSIYKNGRHIPISIMGLDVCSDDVHETGLTWDHGDGDLLAWPIPGSLKLLHNTTPARAEVLMTMYELDGQPMSSDPRHALMRQVAKFKDRGLHPAGAFELEFFLLSQKRDADGKIMPAAAVLDGKTSRKTDVYSVDYIQGFLPLFNDVYAAADKAGIRAETVISEFAPGQYELTIDYRHDVLQAADDLVRLKRIVRAQARAHGIDACFMAKPMAAFPGSGMHFHVSVQNDQGNNIFAEADGEGWSDTIRHAIGGLRDTMAESMLIFAPHLNSWRRFASNSYAPISRNWGVNNRSVALRIPAGAKRARRIEHRPSGVDANPYLVGATVLAGILHGLDHHIDPGPMTEGNGYDNKSDTSMPVDWRTAIEAAKASNFLKSALGEDMHRTYTAIKEAEYNRVQQIISEVDFDLYLHTI